MPARRMRRAAALWALALLSLFALGQSAAVAKSSHSGRATYYVVKNAKAKCKAHYTKQTVTLKVRRHHAWVHVHQIRCVYTGNGAGPSGGGGGVPAFPVNLPTAGITVTAIPTAVGDSYTTAANQPLSVGSSSGVLANDSGLGLSAALVSGATHGIVTLDRDGGFRYTPAAGYSGIDHFDYHATDSSGQSSGAAQVAIHVTPLGAAPGTYSVAGGSTLTVGAPGLLAGAVGSGLHAQLATSPGHGSVSVNADGSFSYSSASGFVGLDSFQFVVADGAGQSSAALTVLISVGASPPSVVAETFSGAVGNTELQVGGARGGRAEVYLGNSSALTNDSDPSGGTLSTQPASITTAHGGTVSLASDGTFSYQPPVGFAGPSDSFSYQVLTSEGQSAQANATIDFNGARVWYVDASAPAGGSGSSAAPFNSLAAVSAPGGAAGSGDVVFLFPGSYGGGIALAANETLVGAPGGLTVGSESLLVPSGGANPVITNASSASAGVSLADGDSVSAVAVNATAGAGISVVSANSFTIDSSVTVTNAGADGIDVSGGGGDASVGATVSGSAAHAVDVANRSSGTLTFTGPISDHGDGLLLSSNTNANVAFTGAITAATTNADPAFEAIGGGTVTATSAANTLSSTGAAALDVESTAIGSGGLTFLSVSAGSSGSGPSYGVFLSGTGAGTVTVNGGTIEHTTSAAVSASNGGGVSLAQMVLEPSSGAGVSVSAVASLTVSSSTITGGAAGIAATGNASPLNLSIIGNTLTGQSATAISLNTAGAATVEVVANNIGSEGPPAVAGSTTADGIDISAASGTTTAHVTGNTVDQIDNGYGIRAQASAGAALNLVLKTNTVNMNSSSSLDGVLVASLGASANVCLDSNANAVAAAGNSSSANAMEIHAVSGSVFGLATYSGNTDAAASAFLRTNDPSLTATGSGASPALATSVDGFSGCTSPDSGNA